MNKELDILTDIYTFLSHNIDHIKSSNNDILRIQKSITELDNNYFETHCDFDLLTKYINMIDDEETCNKTVDTLKLFIKHKINNICNHDWVYDAIDINPDMSKYIYYCVKCEVTKK